MADTSVVDLNADLVGARRGNLNVFDAQLLAGLPGDGSLAGNGLFLELAGNELSD